MNCWTDYNQDTCDNAYFETALHVQEVLSNSAAISVAWEPPSMNFGQGHMVKESYTFNDNQSNLYTMKPRYQYDEVSHAVPQDCTMPDYIDTPQTRHPDQSTYCTDWEISHNSLHNPHINSEELNYNDFNMYVKQWSQEPGNPSASDDHYDQSIQPSLYESQYEYRSASLYPQPEPMWNTSPVPVPSTLVSRDASLSTDNTLSASPYPYSFQSNSQSQSQTTSYTPQPTSPVHPAVPTHTPYTYTSFTGSPYIPPVNNSTPVVSYIQPPSAPYPVHVYASGQVAQESTHPQRPEQTSTSLYPCSPIVPSKVHPTPHELSSSSSVQPSLPGPTTSLDNIPSAPIAPSRTSRHRVAPTKKRARSSTKTFIVGTHASLATVSQQDTTVNQKHVPIRSRRILDEYFTRPEWRCRLCESATQFKKESRALEHLVSHHMFQEVKNIKIYDKNRFDKGEDIGDGRPKRLIITKAQFEYARSWVEVVKCGKCLKTETSLFYRKNAINSHLRRHRDLKGPEKKEERDRLAGLAPKSWEGYRSFNDKVLFNLPL